jgi:autotransporter-associated beta strand protein
MLIGVDTASSTGIINQTGGAITNTTSDTQLAGYNHGTGIWNLDGGLAVLSLLMICHDNNGDSIGTMNLNTNGALIVSQISGNGSVAASTFNFNGGTLMPGGANANFMSGLTRANVRNGGVIIDDGGFAVAISQNLTHSAIGGDNATDGGLIKNGNGTLALSGVNTYTGDTMVNAGTLEFDVTGSSASALRLANGTLLNLNFSGLFAVAHFYTNGVSLPNGTYNAGNLPGFITGSGNLQVSSTSLGIWDGGGMDNNWSTAANWDNGAEPIFPIGLTFAGSTRLVNNNDLSSITAASITFDAAAEAFVLNGNGITLAGNLGFNGNPAVPVTQTVNLSMGWTGSETIDTPTNGGLTLGGDITSSVDTSLIKLDAGTLTLGGTNTIASWDLDGGTTTITGNTTISGDGNSRIYVGDGDAFPNCSGTLIIQDGATLAINGDFADSFVIGRDSGSGTLIQNGGTLTFNPGNAPQNFFIGATSKAGTRSEFDMNGGLLDLNGNNFDVALGDRGVLSTGVVNQVSGAIANAGSLQLGALTATGCGVYNLSGGSLYLGAGGITTVSGNYALNLGGGTVGATASWASALNVNLTNLNGSVTFDTAGNTITLSGVLTGTGGLTVTGAGTLELSGPNTYTGDTTVNASTTLQLDVTGGSQGAVYLAKGAVLNLNFTGAHAVAACFTNGVALANGSYNANNLTGFITGGGVLTVGITPLTPTSISYSVSGGSLTINWPANYLGWVLQIQTNGLDAGLGTNWVDVAGSADVTSTNLPVNPAIPATFYRLRYP